MTQGERRGTFADGRRRLQNRPISRGSAEHGIHKSSRFRFFSRCRDSDRLVHSREGRNAIEVEKLVEPDS
jgi:hypothetical protein